MEITVANCYLLELERENLILDAIWASHSFWMKKDAFATDFYGTYQKELAGHANQKNVFWNVLTLGKYKSSWLVD